MPNERMAAETLKDRGALKANQKGLMRYVHKYSWLVRLVELGTSWAAPKMLNTLVPKSPIRKWQPDKLQVWLVTTRH